MKCEHHSSDFNAICIAIYCYHILLLSVTTTLSDS